MDVNIHEQLESLKVSFRIKEPLTRNKNHLQILVTSDSQIVMCEIHVTSWIVLFASQLKPSASTHCWQNTLQCMTFQMKGSY